MKFDSVSYSHAEVAHHDGGAPPPVDSQYTRREIPMNIPTPIVPVNAQIPAGVTAICYWATSGILGGIGLWLAITAQDGDTGQEQLGTYMGGIFITSFCYSTLFCCGALVGKTKSQESKPLLEV